MSPGSVGEETTRHLVNSSGEMGGEGGRRTSSGDESRGRGTEGVGTEMVEEEGGERILSAGERSARRQLEGEGRAGKRANMVFERGRSREEGRKLSCGDSFRSRVCLEKKRKR